MVRAVNFMACQRRWNGVLARLLRSSQDNSSQSLDRFELINKLLKQELMLHGTSLLLSNSLAGDLY